MSAPKITTETITEDPYTYGASIGGRSVYIGDVGESRAQVRRVAERIRDRMTCADCGAHLKHCICMEDRA